MKEWSGFEVFATIVMSWRTITLCLMGYKGLVSDMVNTSIKSNNPINDINLHCYGNPGINHRNIQSSLETFSDPEHHNTNDSRLKTPSNVFPMLFVG